MQLETVEVIGSWKPRDKKERESVDEDDDRPKLKVNNQKWKVNKNKINKNKINK